MKNWITNRLHKIMNNIEHNLSDVKAIYVPRLLLKDVAKRQLYNDILVGDTTLCAVDWWNETFDIVVLVKHDNTDKSYWLCNDKHVIKINVDIESIELNVCPVW